MKKEISKSSASVISESEKTGYSYELSEMPSESTDGIVHPYSRNNEKNPEHEFIEKTASDSFFWIDCDTEITSKDEMGNPAEGTRLFINEKNERIITRWKNGLLDGDVTDENGNLITMPAVESGGHIEYWRKGKLHRDGELPAVSASGFSKEEWWKENKRYR